MIPTPQAPGGLAIPGSYSCPILVNSPGGPIDDAYFIFSTTALPDSCRSTYSCPE